VKNTIGSILNPSNNNPVQNTREENDVIEEMILNDIYSSDRKS